MGRTDEVSQGTSQEVCTQGLPVSECDDRRTDHECHEEDQVDSMAAFFLQAKRRGIQAGAARIMYNAWSKPARKQQEVVWKQWRDFCGKQGISHFSMGIGEAVEFADFLFTEMQFQPSTISSKLSHLLDILQTEPRPNHHPNVTRFLDQLHKIRPPKRINVPTWDVKQVLDMLESEEWYNPPHKEAYSKLTLKTCMLVALASCKRPSDLGLLSLHPDYCTYTDSSISFFPVFGAKNRRKGHAFTPRLVLRKSENRKLCPFRHVMFYWKVTKDREERADALFVTRRQGPATAACAKTLASWLQEVIEQAGIQASGGTTRKASATFAITAGASIAAVMEAGDWAQASTAFKHYIKDLPAGVKQRIHEQTVDNVQAKNLGNIQV